MNQSELKFNIGLDENNVPEKISWQSTEISEKGDSDAVLISIWDKKEQNTLKIDLWTKDMLVDDMKLFFYQTFLSLADTFERATSEPEMAQDIKDFTKYLGEKMGISK